MMPVEIKSRVSSQSQDCATTRLKQVLGVNYYSPHQKYFLHLGAGDSNLSTLIKDDTDKNRLTKEAYQMLHHAYTYGVDCCMLLVGGRTDLMYAVEVKFPPSLLRSYDAVIRTLFSTYYDFLYHGTFNETSFPSEKVKKGLDLHNQGKKSGDQVTWHAFLTNYRLWRSINVEPDYRAIRFPLPPIDRFLPCQNAEWNLSKGPSDTLTKLFDDCEECITIRTPQTVAVARLMLVLSSAFHRCIQVVSSKNDTTTYRSLDSFRRAANSRASFKSSLSQLCDFLWNEMEGLEVKRRLFESGMGPPGVGNVLNPLVPPQSPNRRTRNRDAPTQNWNEKWESGFTPSKIKGRPGSKKQLQVENHLQRREECLGVVLAVRLDGSRMRCELCGSWTRFYCSGCSSHLCFQTGSKVLSEQKLNNIRTKLHLPPDAEIPLVNKITHYNMATKKRKETRMLNSCYHIAHQRKFTEYFSKVAGGNSLFCQPTNEN